MITPNRRFDEAKISARRAFGFTMVELLVVMTIIGLLLALLLPAVQHAREAALLADCRSRQKQLGLALHQYHAARKQFPAGVVVRDPGVCDGYESQEGMNWMIAILPFVEEQSLYATYNDSLYNEADLNQPIRAANVKLYGCPVDEVAGTVQVPWVGPAAAGALNRSYVAASYRGVSGRSQGTVFLDSAAAPGYPMNYRGVLHAVGLTLPGFKAEKFQTIKDGSSTTLMVGENASVTNLGVHSMWAYSFQFYTLSAVTIQPRTLAADYDSCVNQGGTGGAWPCQRGWSSGHPRTVNFAMADGSVRSIDSAVDMTVVARMATIDGEEPAQE